VTNRFEKVNVGIPPSLLTPNLHNSRLQDRTALPNDSPGGNRMAHESALGNCCHVVSLLTPILVQMRDHPRDRDQDGLFVEY